MSDKPLLFCNSAMGIIVQVIFAGEDISVVVSGGEKSHIGSVSVAVPRDSLRGGGKRSATVSTINMVGHKDNVIGNMFAQELAAKTGRVCVVACGIHNKDIDDDGIEHVILASKRLLTDVLDAV